MKKPPDAPLYLHFLDRELGNSVSFELSGSQVEFLAKCIVLATTTPLYCGLSLLWESPGVTGEALLLLSLMIETGALEAVSHHSNLPEFISSRQSIYSHDSPRYPMYFKSQVDERLSFRPTIYKDTGTTSSLTAGMSLWASGVQGIQRAPQEIENIVRSKVLLSLSRRSEQAITFSLFAPELTDIPRPHEVHGFVRRLISEQYTEHYLDFGGGDILTGARGLEYFDHLSRHFPVNDVVLLTKLIEISGLGFLLRDPWRQHYSSWQYLMTNRGSGVAHQDLRSIIRAILIGFDSMVADLSTRTHFARRAAILGLLNSSAVRSPWSGASLGAKDIGGQLVEASANLRGFAKNAAKLMGVNFSMLQRDISDSLHVDVLLVTVTEIEAQTLISLLRENFGRGMTRKFLGERTYYDFGIVGGARVYMVQSEMGSGGPSGSILTVKHGIDAFTPSAVILVGIAFGIDPSSQSIGDILVSRQLRPYELQRASTTSAGGLKILPRGDKPSASVRLLDRFRSGALDWTGPRVEFDVVLSGDKLVDNIDFRDQLLEIEPEAIGGEMEGAGLYAAAQSAKVDWIVVKAISDWADGKKRHRKKERQKIAAESSGQLVFHVLRQGGFV